MIPTSAEITAALTTVLQLVRGDLRAIERFDVSLDGFFKSFFAIVLAAPAYALLLAQRYDSAELPVSLSLVVAVELFSYVGGWLAFPVVMAFLTRFLGLGQRYAPLIVATNWCAVVQLFFLLAVSVVAGFLPEAPGAALQLVATLLLLAFEWLVVRLALNTSGGIAAALVVIDVLLSLLIDLATSSFLTSFAG